MRQRIALQEAARAADDNGQLVSTWTTVAGEGSIPAQYIPTSGGETIHGKQMEAGIRAVFVVRYRSGVYSPENRISYGGLYYGIVYVTDIDGQRRYQRIECRAVNDG